MNEESGEEILLCSSFGENTENITYSWFYKSSDKQISAAKLLVKKLKTREKIREEVT